MNLIRHVEDIARGLLADRERAVAAGMREPPASRLPGAAFLLAAARASIGRPPWRPGPPAVAALEAACSTSRDCGRTAVCRASVCRCAPGWDRCGTDRCHYLPMSHHHCGRCGAACGPDHLCANGRCA